MLFLLVRQKKYSKSSIRALNFLTLLKISSSGDERDHKIEINKTRRNECGKRVSELEGEPLQLGAEGVTKQQQEGASRSFSGQKHAQIYPQVGDEEKLRCLFPLSTMNPVLNSMATFFVRVMFFVV